MSIDGGGFQVDFSQLASVGHQLVDLAERLGITTATLAGEHGSVSASNPGFQTGPLALECANGWRSEFEGYAGQVAGHGDRLAETRACYERAEDSNCLLLTPPR